MPPPAASGAELLLRACVLCKHLRPAPPGGGPPVCALFERTSLVTGCKEPVPAEAARAREAMCGREGRRFVPLGEAYPLSYD